MHTTQFNSTYVYLFHINLDSCVTHIFLITAEINTRNTDIAPWKERTTQLLTFLQEVTCNNLECHLWGISET